MAINDGLARLKTRADFLRVAAGRNRAVRPGLMLQARSSPPGNDGLIRIGFTASRKVGNAVIRNRAKRRLRAVAAEVLRDAGQTGMDYVLIARNETGTRPYAELMHDLASALRQVHRPRGGENRDAFRRPAGEEG